MKQNLKARRASLTIVCLLILVLVGIVLFFFIRPSGFRKANKANLRTYETLEEAKSRLLEVQELEKQFDREISKGSGKPSSFQGSGAVQFVAWQKKFRKQLGNLLGLESERKVEEIETARPERLIVNIETGNGKQTEKFSYTRQKIILRGVRGDRVKIWLLKPVDRSSTSISPRCVVCLPGHSRDGVDSIVGIEKSGETRTTFGGEYQDYALQFLSRGYVVAAVEQSGMGTRRHEVLKLLGINGNTPCEFTSFLDGLGSTSTLGYRVSDVGMVADYLRNREDIRPGWLAVAGASAGGTTALFSAALDERFDACVVISYFNTFEDSILARKHCGCNYVNGLTETAEMSDVACLIAPRCLFVEFGCFDNYFPPEGALKAIRDARAGWRILNAPEHLDKRLAPRGHLGFTGTGLFEFLSRCEGL